METSKPPAAEVEVFDGEQLVGTIPVGYQASSEETIQTLSEAVEEQKKDLESLSGPESQVTESEKRDAATALSHLESLLRHAREDA
eukprot:jgi/Mesen1/4406/ME000225S03394